MTRSSLSAPRGILTKPVEPRHTQTPPTSALRESVAHCWGVSWDLRGQPAQTAETLPHPSVHMVFEGRRAEVAGVQRGKFSRQLRGRGAVFGIKFRPAAFHPLLGGPLNQ